MSLCADTQGNLLLTVDTLHLFERYLSAPAEHLFQLRAQSPDNEAATALAHTPRDAYMPLTHLGEIQPALFGIQSSAL